MISSEQVQTLVGQDVHGSDGERIGSVGQVYFDDVTGDLAWVTVRTGLFGSKETFVPTDDAHLGGSGLTVPFTKDVVKGAPNVDTDQHLSAAEEAELYDYYGLDHGGTAAEHGTGTPVTDTRGTTSGTDDAMTLSEERVEVGTERVETGRVRLRKHVVTEDVATTVPVTHEVARVEHEPITDANRAAALSGPEIRESEYEVVLHDEVPVVDKETVPVERVRLGTEQVTEQQAVTEQVRKERVETDGLDADGLRP